ncbi:divalent-cation tolerance protein CutA [Erythrobacter sp. KY5]|uniref:divalent-cation tolerance protein CutA n=1 Tax=Erythrobacter sp. KY5 TaxID=2011159 RepID=UPI000DBF2B99|nr:divalent-cation tolerance protein CutA [Erythrobacter sp. KY5]AWW73242.1 divalent-cation tolerance protein CutA [Erythrobacter sp. KY5]
MSEFEAALAWCPFPNAESAKEVASTLLEEKLIACANIMPGVTSVFEWEGQCATQAEVAVLFKTSEQRLERLIARLGECHPYDTPAIVGWLCNASHPATKHWLEKVLREKTLG